MVPPVRRAANRRDGRVADVADVDRLVEIVPETRRDRIDFTRTQWVGVKRIWRLALTHEVLMGHVHSTASCSRWRLPIARSIRRHSDVALRDDPAVHLLVLPDLLSRGC
jgi:hypothetical protein